MKTSLRLVCVLSFLMATAALSSAEMEFLKAFPETSGVRSLIASRWLTAPVAAVSPLQDEVVTDAYGESARVSVTGRGKSLSVTLYPVGYSGESLRGRWVLLRDAATGDPLSIEIFPLEDSAISVVLRPGSESKTLLDLRIYGRDLRRGVPFGSAFQSLLTAPFSLVVSLTERTVPWELLSPDPLRYEGISKAVETIRSRLDRLVYLDDGAFNAEGRPVLISSGLDQNPKAVLEAAGTGRDLYIQKVNDHSNPNLRFYCIFRCTIKTFYLQVLLNSFKKEFYTPTFSVYFSNLFRTTASHVRK